MDTTLGTFLPALKEALQARAGLTDVAVWTGDPDNTQPPFSKAIILGSGEAPNGKAGAIEVTGDWRAIGRRSREESYTIPGEVLTVEYGGGEAVIAAARNAALSLLAEVNECLWDPANIHLAGTQDAHITGYTLYQGIGGENGNARAAYITFTISVKAQLIRGA